MVEKKFEELGKLKVGRYIILEGEPCRITDIKHSKAGKHGAAKIRLEGVSLITGNKYTLLKPAKANVEVPIINKRNAQVLTVQGDTANVMDLESYETFDIKIPEEFKDKVVEGVQIFYWDIMGHKMIVQVKSGE